MVDFVVPFADLGDAKPQVNSTSACQVRISEVEPIFDQPGCCLVHFSVYGGSHQDDLLPPGGCLDHVPASVREQRGGR